MSNWITYNITGGTGNTTITITAATSEELQARLTTLRGETTFQHKTADVNIMQKRYYPYDYIIADPDNISFTPTTLFANSTVEASIDWAVCDITYEKDTNIQPDTGCSSNTIMQIVLEIPSANTSYNIFGGNNTAYPYRIDSGNWVLPTDSEYPLPVLNKYNCSLSFDTTGDHSFDMDFSRPYKKTQYGISTYSWEETSLDNITNIDILFPKPTSANPIYWKYVFYPNILVSKPNKAGTFEGFSNARIMEFDCGFPNPDYISFNDCSREIMESVTFSSGVTTIPGDFFSNNVSTGGHTSYPGHGSMYVMSEAYYLTNVNLPNALKNIERRAFYNCTSLTSITLPDSVEYIGDGAFANTGLQGQLRLPLNLRKVGNIGYYATPNYTNRPSVEYFATGVTSIVFSPYVRELSYDTFKGFPNLTDIYFPCYSAPTIDQAFEGLPASGTVHYPEYAVNLYGNLREKFPSGWDFIMDITSNWEWQIGL